MNNFDNSKCSFVTSFPKNIDTALPSRNWIRNWNARDKLTTIQWHSIFREKRRLRLKRSTLCAPAARIYTKRISTAIKASPSVSIDKLSDYNAIAGRGYITRNTHTIFHFSDKEKGRKRRNATDRGSGYPRGHPLIFTLDILDPETRVRFELRLQFFPLPLSFLSPILTFLCTFSSTLLPSFPFVTPRRHVLSLLLAFSVFFQPSPFCALHRSCAHAHPRFSRHFSYASVG